MKCKWVQAVVITPLQDRVKPYTLKDMVVHPSQEVLFEPSSNYHPLPNLTYLGKAALIIRTQLQRTVDEMNNLPHFEFVFRLSYGNEQHWSLLWMTTRGLRMGPPGSQKFSRPSTIFPSVLASGIAGSIVFQWFSSFLHDQFHSELVEERGQSPCFVGCLRVPFKIYM